jgi:hypothetical protein
MPTVPFPKRVFGKVDEYGGELAASTFVHLWVLPILPTGSLWITSAAGWPVARRIKWHGRSIAAAYLRAWVPIVWAWCLGVDTLTSYCGGAVALALYVWSWTWRMAHRERDQLVKDFDLVTTGSQCPPERLRGEDRQALLTSRQAELAKLARDRSPEDLARFGSSDAEELLAAYGALRLAAATHVPSGPWRAAARRIIDGKHDQLGEQAGIFRHDRGSAPRLTATQLAEVARERARFQRARAVISASRMPKTWLQQILWGPAWPLGYLALGVAILGGIGMFGLVRDPDQFEVITERRLRDAVGLGEVHYRVECASLTRFLAAAEADTIDDQAVYLCKLGGKLLPVLSEDQEGIAGNVVRGRLLPRNVFRRPYRWERLLDEAPQGLRAPVVYLDTDVPSKLGQIISALSWLLGSAVILVVWHRLRRQRKREIAAAKVVARNAGARAPTGS